jgi:hypothetical protein
MAPSLGMEESPINMRDGCGCVARTPTHGYEPTRGAAMARSRRTEAVAGSVASGAAASVALA